MAGLLAILPTVSVRAETPPAYLEDQAIDQELGLFNLPWPVDLARMPSRFDQPQQVQSGGLPPYDQEVEEAQTFGAPGTPVRPCNPQLQQC